jgi:hypothetical protein
MIASNDDEGGAGGWFLVDGTSDILTRSRIPGLEQLRRGKHEATTMRIPNETDPVDQ